MRFYECRSDWNRATFHLMQSGNPTTVDQPGESAAGNLQPNCTAGLTAKIGGQFPGILECAPDALILCDAQGVIVFVNAMTEGVFGYPRRELVGEPVAMLTSDRVDGFPDGCLDASRAALSPRQIGVGLRLMGRRKDGRMFPIEISASTVGAGDEALTFYSIRDHTESRWVETMLVQSEQIQTALLNALPERIAVIDVHGMITAVNQPWLTFAREFENIDANAFGVGAPYFDACRVARIGGDTFPDAVVSGIRAVLSGSVKEFRAECRCDSPDAERWFLVHAVSAPHQIGGAIVSHTDITDHMRAEQEVRELNAVLEDRVAARTADLREANHALVAEIAERKRLESEILEISEQERRRIGEDLHNDICQQLSAIAMMNEALSSRLRGISAGDAAEARNLSKLLSQTLGDIRTLIRGLNLVEVDSRGLMAALDQLAKQAGRRVPCRVDCREPVLFNDSKAAGHLFRIAQEAVTNALKHSGAGEIVIGLKRRGQRLVLSIRDDGAGLSKEQSDGTGMRVMSYRARMIDATLDVLSEAGKGTGIICSIAMPADPAN